MRSKYATEYLISILDCHISNFTSVHNVQWSTVALEIAQYDDGDVTVDNVDVTIDDLVPVHHAHRHMDMWQAAVCTFGRAHAWWDTVCIAYLHVYIGTGTFNSCVKATKIFIMWQPRGVITGKICTRFRNLGISLKISGFQKHFKISCSFQDFM